MGKRNQQYIHRVAVDVLRRIGGISYAGDDQHDWYETDKENFPQTVWLYYGVKIIGVVSDMGPAARGKIADCGVPPNDPSGSLSFTVVSGEGAFDGVIYGRQVSVLLASYIVAAAIVDILRAGVRERRKVAQTERDELDRSERDYIHHGPRASALGDSTSLGLHVMPNGHYNYGR